MIKNLLICLSIILLYSCEGSGGFGSSLPKTNNDNCGTCYITVVPPQIPTFGYAYGDLMIRVCDAKTGNELQKNVFSGDNGSPQQIEVECGKKLIIKVTSMWSCAGTSIYGGAIAFVTGEIYISPQSCNEIVKPPYMMVYTDC